MTTSDPSRQVHDYSSSEPMVVSLRCEAALELGRRLTKELGIDQSVDTLGRWMAHYIAELIQDAEKASAEERPVKMRACCDAILNLWKHRHTFASGKRPFEELGPFLRVIESLDVENETPRYFRLVRSAANDAEEKDDTKFWLNLVDQLDYSAKVLIRFLLTQAAQASLNKSSEWVTLAEAAGADESAEYHLIRVLSYEDSMLKVSDPGEEEKRRIEDRIQRLEAFANMAKDAASKLRREGQQAEGLGGES